MTEGYRLFYEDQQDAIKSAIDNNVRGWTFKEVAHRVYPDRKPESAYARLKSIVHPEKDEKADLWEVRQICVVTGRYDPLYYLCDVCDHARPPKRAPQDRIGELVEQFNTAVATVDKLHQQIQAAGGVGALRAIAGGKP